MARGGLFDQIGGGFARYSVDNTWCIPHFEKMLYDNALLISVYTKAWLRYRNPLYRSIVFETIAWLQREMPHPEGGFCASLDADTNGEEGVTYTWTPEQIKAVIGDEQGTAFCQLYSITPKGNFEKGLSNPMLSDSDFGQREAWQKARAQLLDNRSKRPQPERDRKRVLSWNSLTIRALAEAGFHFGQREWFAMAKVAADWLWENALDEDNLLYSVIYDDGEQRRSCLDDYAFFAEALMALSATIDGFEAGKSSCYRERAERLVNTIFIEFGDASKGGTCYFTSKRDALLPHRSKVWFDNATPAGNAALVHTLAELYAATGKDEYQKRLNELDRDYLPWALKAPQAIPYALAGFAQTEGIAAD